MVKLVLSHFMLQFIGKKNIKRAGSISGFFENKNSSIYLEKYPLIKFIFWHSIDLVLELSVIRLGGPVEIILVDTNFIDD